MPELSLGISPCPNDIFIFSGLLLGEVQIEGNTFRVEYEDVETTNQRSQRGEYDVVKISYANLPLVLDRYTLLPCGGALGRGVGPLLLAHDGAWNPDAETLVPGEFTTANFLLDFWAQRPLRKRFLPFDALYAELCERPGAQGVVIHEKRFTYVHDGLTRLQDLGTYWEQKTGYTIPLGAIVARKELPQEPLIRAIRESLHWAYAHDDRAFDLCRQHAQDLTPGVIRSHIELYVNEYSDDLGPDGWAAVAFFLEQQKTSRNT
jgi:1,4-dihydroxy-6-naphthoate synthase